MKYEDAQECAFNFSKILSWPLFLGLFVLALDIGSKYWIQSHLISMNQASYSYPYGGIGIFKDFFGIEFSLVHQTNRGAAWGLGSQYQVALLVIRMILVAGVIYWSLFVNKNKKYVIPLALVIAGAIGNILDYFIYGQVIDMFHVVLWGWDYPVFNIADSAISIGIVWLILISYL